MKRFDKAAAVLILLVMLVVAVKVVVGAISALGAWIFWAAVVAGAIWALLLRKPRA